MKKGAVNLDTIASMSLPDIPNTRPVDENHYAVVETEMVYGQEWYDLRKTAKELHAQFKSDFQMLQTTYFEAMNQIVNEMNSYTKQ